MNPIIDIVADMGEGFGNYTIADDSKLLDLISSANVACGFHAGDPQIMSETVKKAIENNIGIGAHPAFPDLVGFGRRKIDATKNQVTTDVMYQLGALASFVNSYGGKLQHVTPHGALGNLVATEKKYANAVLDAVKLFNPELVILSQPDEFLFTAKERGFKTASIIFADRAYDDNGKIVSRSHPNAILSNINEIIPRCLDMILNNKVKTITGNTIEVQGDALLIHGDTEGSLKMASKIRKALKDEEIAIKSIGEQLKI